MHAGDFCLEKDGFAILQTLRANAALAATPVILLTSLQERAHMRMGMTTGQAPVVPAKTKSVSTPWVCLSASCMTRAGRKTHGR